MKNLAFIIFFVTVILCGCNQNPKTTESIPTVGELDSADIARDTARQKAIEDSYEFATSLTISPTLVFDIRAFGGPASKGGFAIIRRGANNKPDTVAQGIRYGAIKNTFAADLNNNKQTEVYIVTHSTDSNSYADIIAYQFDSIGGATGIILPGMAAEERASGYRGHDSIYAEGNYLVRQFPVYKDGDRSCCPSGPTNKIYYRLVKNIFVKQKSATASK